jgi:lipoprotein-anchoring transpeptidase ErfK/SrfK
MRVVLVVVLVGVIAAGSVTAVFLYKAQKKSEQAQNAVELAASFLEQGKVEDAVNVLSPIYKTYPRFKAMDRVVYLLATAYERTGSDHAPALWRQLAENFPQSPYHAPAALAWARSLVASDPSRARTILEPLLALQDRETAAAALAARAATFLTEKNTAEARALYQQILERYPGTTAEEEAFDQLSEITMRIFFSPELDEFTKLYQVKPGDSVHKIAIENHTTRDLVMRLNGIATDIRPGQQIKIPNTEFKIVIDKSRLRIFLLTADGRFVKWYPVGIGTTDYKTPAGLYQVKEKQIDPTWYKPGGGVIPSGDPENALGPRWIGIGQHLGIHGNNDPSSVGQRASAGCIRMLNDDVKELYEIITIGNEVRIVDRFDLAGAQQASEKRNISSATEEAR